VSTVIDPVVWDGVRRQPGPARGVVLVALAVSVLLIGGAWTAAARGLTAPRLTTDGASAEWSDGASTSRATVRLYNVGLRDVTVVGATLVRGDGSPVAYARISGIDPVLVPAGGDQADQAAATELRLTITVDCPSALASPGDADGLRITTTGTWPDHVALVGFYDVTGSCALPSGTP